MKLGSVERWTLVNTTHEWHTFHMHIDDFQVVSQNGVAVPYVDYEDNVALPPGSHTVVLVQAADFTGRFVFHCHVTFHEDHGMMATIEVVREPGAAASRRLSRAPGGARDQLLCLRVFGERAQTSGGGADARAGAAVLVQPESRPAGPGGLSVAAGTLARAAPCLRRAARRCG